MAVVYRHRRLDNNKVFYVGIGKSDKRAYSKSNNRSIFWKNIVEKAGYSIEVLVDNISWKQACELEQFLISEYGRRDLGTGILVNMTDGGEGSKGYKRKVKRKFSEKSRRKMSLSHKIKGISKEHRQKINRGFVNMSEESLNSMKRTQFKSKEVINVLTGQVYDSIKQLSQKENVGYDRLKKQLSGKTKKTLPYDYKRI